MSAAGIPHTKRRGAEKPKSGKNTTIRNIVFGGGAAQSIPRMASRKIPTLIINTKTLYVFMVENNFSFLKIYPINIPNENSPVIDDRK